MSRRGDRAAALALLALLLGLDFSKSGGRAGLREAVRPHLPLEEQQPALRPLHLFPLKTSSGVSPL